MKNIKKTYLELFLNKILKSGKKYKYFLTIKNLVKLYDLIYDYLPNKEERVVDSNTFSKEQLLKKFHGYTFIKKVIKKKKKFKKIINVTKLNIKQNILKEWFKLIGLIIYKLPVRTLDLKIFYLSLIINNRDIRGLKVLKRLAVLYYKNVKVERKLVKKSFKRKIYWSNNEHNINKSFFKKYKQYIPKYNNRVRLRFIRKSDLLRKKRSRYFKKGKTVINRWIKHTSVFRDTYLKKIMLKSKKKLNKKKKYLDYLDCKLTYNYYIHENSFFTSIFYKLNDFLKKKKTRITYNKVLKYIRYTKRGVVYYRIHNAIKIHPVQYITYSVAPNVFRFSTRVIAFCKRLLRNMKKYITYNPFKMQKYKIFKFFWWYFKSNTSNLTKKYLLYNSRVLPYILYNDGFFALFNTNFKKYVLNVRDEANTELAFIRQLKPEVSSPDMSIYDTNLKNCFKFVIKRLVEKNNKNNLTKIYRGAVSIKKKIFLKKKYKDRVFIFNKINTFKKKLNVKLKKKNKQYIFAEIRGYLNTIHNKTPKFMPLSKFNKKFNKICRKIRLRRKYRQLSTYSSCSFNESYISYLIEFLRYNLKDIALKNFINKYKRGFKYNMNTKKLDFGSIHFDGFYENKWRYKELTALVLSMERQIIFRRLLKLLKPKLIIKKYKHRLFTLLTRISKEL